MKAAIVGVSGPALTEAETALFHTHPPAGVILFGRNLENPAQLAELVGTLRRVLPREAVLMVDQEGGRVARLNPPHYAAHPPAELFGRLHAADPEAGLRAAWLTGALIGLDCARAGCDVVCAPVLDLRVPGAHDVIGDRAYGSDPEKVAALGGAVADGLLAAGVQPVAKHIPGHGRATADSHLELPRVAGALEADFAPFAANAHLPWAMTAHILYTALDAVRPATLSPVVIGQVIRARIGFAGVLISDDLAMRALSGALGALAAEALAAGCDLVLHCTGEWDANCELLPNCPDIHPQAATRMRAGADFARRRRAALDGEALARERAALLGRFLH